MNAALTKLAPTSVVPDKKWALGKAVVDGQIQYLSVSQIQSFATCPRLWFLDKVKGLPKKQLKAQQLGTDAHRQWAHYLTTGEDVLGDIARIAKPLLPEPGPDLLVEQAFCPVDVPGGHLQSEVRAAGIPLVGDIDLVNPRRLATEGIVRVTDHKTSSNPATYAATPRSLAHIDLDAIRSDAPGNPGAAIQMTGYGIWVLRRFPTARLIEYEHIITPTKGPKRDAKPLSVLATVTPEDIARERRTLDAVVTEMKGVATAGSLSDVPPNWSACEKYGGCSFKAQCLTYKEKKTMGVMDLLKKGNAAPAASTPLPPPPAAVQPPAPVAEPKRMAIEDKSTGVLARNAIQGTRYKLPNGKLATFTCLTAIGGDSFASFRYVEGGKPELLGLDDYVIPETTPAPAAPPSAPVEVVQSQPPATPLPAPEPTPEPQAAAPIEQPAPAAEEKPKRKRRTKAEMEAARAAGQEVPADEQPEELRIFVDAIPNGPHQSLSAYIAGIVKQIETAFDVVDIRCAPKKTADGKDHPLAFGGWKGALSGAIKAEPPAPGTYVALGAAGSEIAQVAIEALEPLCAPGCFVRGVR